MRTLVLVAIGLGLSLVALPSRTIHAQDDGGITRLSSAAYAPDSPVRENKLFRYQTGHYGFAYNCDGEEDKRNNPAICWRKADQCQLPKRMGCLERVRHEVAQVSRRILDGMCDSGCETCQQQRRQSVTEACGCENCVASQDIEATADMDSLVDVAADQTTQPLGLLAALQAEHDQATIESAVSEPVSAGGRSSGLISVIELAPPMESIQPPVARITSATFGSGLDSVEASRESNVIDGAVVLPPPPSTHQMGLLERLKKAQSAQADDLSKPAKF